MRLRYFVYIFTNANNTALYAGVTNDLEKRTINIKKKLMMALQKGIILRN